MKPLAGVLFVAVVTVVGVIALGPFAIVLLPLVFMAVDAFYEQPEAND